MKTPATFNARVSRDGKSFVAVSPEFPEGIGQGISEEEALESLRDSILLLLEVRREGARASLGRGEVLIPLALAKRKDPPACRKLEELECRYYRDQLRNARYAALANAEGFDEICFTLEALGLRLLGQQGDLGKYKNCIGSYAHQSPVLNDMPRSRSSWFKTFEALYETVLKARNDSMHTGAYARHATTAAIELCIGLEEALMINVKRNIGSLMVKSPVTIEPWQPVAHARQLMLMHSFSFLPIWHEDKWWLLSELGLAKFLNVSNAQRKILLGLTIEEANRHQSRLDLTQIDKNSLYTSERTIDELLQRAASIEAPTLWLVIDHERKDHLAGVLSPFELM